MKDGADVMLAAAMEGLEARKLDVGLYFLARRSS